MAGIGQTIRKKIKIRTRILIVFSVLLLFSFSLIWGVFNIAARNYIQDSAVGQLDSFDSVFESMAGMEIIVDALPPKQMEEREAELGIRGNTFRIHSNMFVIDDMYNPLGNEIVSSEITAVIQALKDSGADLNNLNNRRISGSNGVYYVSAHHIIDMQTGENAYWIVYADITGLTYFTSAVNLFMIIVVYIMFTVAVIVTFFLSDSITRPIKKLSRLASNIGNGDFTSHDLRLNETELENLNMVLNKTARQLGVYDSEQKAFFQNVSHELRTPLMSIKCYAEGISFGVMDAKQASGTILQETDRLSELVKDLLYISKIDNITSAYIKSQVDLIELMRTCADQHNIIAETKQIRFSFDFCESNVYYDCVEELIARAINNLISNALRYAASEIVLSCHKKAAQIVIRVSDDGKGIETDAMPHIFERFYKGSDGNHGIGLSLVKSIIEQHNGIVTAENSENGGAVFTITLPCTTRR